MAKTVALIWNNQRLREDTASVGGGLAFGQHNQCIFESDLCFFTGCLLKSRVAVLSVWARAACWSFSRRQPQVTRDV